MRLGKEPERIFFYYVAKTTCISGRMWYNKIINDTENKGEPYETLP